MSRAESVDNDHDFVTPARTIIIREQPVYVTKQSVCSRPIYDDVTIHFTSRLLLHLSCDKRMQFAGVGEIVNSKLRA